MEPNLLSDNPVDEESSPFNHKPLSEILVPTGNPLFDNLARSKDSSPPRPQQQADATHITLLSSDDEAEPPPAPSPDFPAYSGFSRSSDSDDMDDEIFGQSLYKPTQADRQMLDNHLKPLLENRNKVHYRSPPRYYSRSMNEYDEELIPSSSQGSSESDSSQSSSSTSSDSRRSDSDEEDEEEENLEGCSDSNGEQGDNCNAQCEEQDSEEIGCHLDRFLERFSEVNYDNSDSPNDEDRYAVDQQDDSSDEQ
jgi:hypothetical protein